MASIHEHLIPKKKNFKVKITDSGKSGKPEHVIYGLWVGVLLLTLIPKKGKKVKEKDVLKSYDVIMRTIGML